MGETPWEASARLDAEAVALLESVLQSPERIADESLYELIERLGYAPHYWTETMRPYLYDALVTLNREAIRRALHETAIRGEPYFPGARRRKGKQNDG